MLLLASVKPDTADSTEIAGVKIPSPERCSNTADNSSKHVRLKHDSNVHGTAVQPWAVCHNNTTLVAALSVLPVHPAAQSSHLLLKSF